MGIVIFYKNTPGFARRADWTVLRTYPFTMLKTPEDHQKAIDYIGEILERGADITEKEHRENLRSNNLPG